MNERIQELIARAEMYADEQNKLYGVSYSQTLNEKFAELIVRECMELCKKQEYDYWRSSEDQDFTPIDCADAIKQHFGIEE
jgi:chorismate mutase